MKNTKTTKKNTIRAYSVRSTENRSKESGRYSDRTDKAPQVGQSVTRRVQLALGTTIARKSVKQKYAASPVAKIQDPRMRAVVDELIESINQNNAEEVEISKKYGLK